MGVGCGVSQRSRPEARFAWWDATSQVVWSGAATCLLLLVFGLKSGIMPYLALVAVYAGRVSYRASRPFVVSHVTQACAFPLGTPPLCSNRPACCRPCAHPCLHSRKTLLGGQVARAAAFGYDASSLEDDIAISTMLDVVEQMHLAMMLVRRVLY